MASNTGTEISRQTLRADNEHTNATISRVHHLASYNWAERQTPTIVGPGCPPAWQSSSRPRQVPKDSGLVFINQNAAHHPDSPLEPLLHALYLENPEFDISSIDVVTDRNNLRKLTSFVNLQHGSKPLEGFTINVEAERNTVLFGRVERADKEVIPPDQFRGFGHEYEKACTLDKVSGTTGHHRIIRYELGGLRFLVRYEADGYIPGGESLSKLPQSDELADMLGAVTLQTSSSALISRRQGWDVPIESILEIKTRVVHKPIALDEIAPQLWLSQTSKVLRAYHSRGVFEAPQVEDVGNRLKAWETRNEQMLLKLVALINRIVELARLFGKASVHYDSMRDKLVIRKVDQKPMLPERWYLKWKGKECLTLNKQGLEDNQERSLQEDAENSASS